MDSLTQFQKKLIINNEYYSGESLTHESEFFEETKELVQKTFDSSSCSFYYGKRMKTFSAELSVTATAEIAWKILTNVDKILGDHFAKKKALHEISWSLAI